MDPYVAGVLVGIGSAAVVIAVMAAVRKKQGRPKPEYDERQMAARGVAYRWAFLTLMLSLAVNTGVEAIWGPWAKPGVSAWMLIFLSIGVFIVACVRKDAYFAVAQNPRTYLWLFGAVVLMLAAPVAGLIVGVIWIGIGALVYGILQIIAAFKVRKLAQ